MSARNSYGIRSLCVAATLLAVVGGGIFASPASAITADSASLTMTSDEGDYIGGGQSYSYSTAANDVFNSTASANAVHVSVDGANGDFWFLDFAAPAGQSLAPGTYSGATRYPFQGPGEPGLDVSGNGRGCNMLTGSFTVSNVTFGPNNYLQSFDVSFEQHCEGAPPALRGQLHVVNPPAPAPLSLSLSLNREGSANRHTGSATVSGSVTCNRPTTVSLFGMLNQRAGREAVASGSFSTEVACSSTPTPWQATISPGNGVPFNPGSAQLEVTASAFDEAYGQQITTTKTVVVKLTRKAK